MSTIQNKAKYKTVFKELLNNINKTLFTSNVVGTRRGWISGWKFLTCLINKYNKIYANVEMYFLL